MAMSFYWIPVKNGEAAEEEMNRCLRTLSVASVERHFSPGLPEPGWAVCIEHATRNEAGKPGVKALPKVDYKEILDEETFRIYAALRDWRKQAADAEKRAVYTVLSNEQLAEAARQRCASLADFEKIEGVGEAKSRKYGEGLLQALAEAVKA